MKTIKIVILGTGNVGYHIAHALHNAKEVNLIQLYNRSPKALKDFEDILPVTTSISQLKEADAYIISVKDEAISRLSGKLNPEVLSIHTSGSTSIDALQTSHKGVLYPLQTFSKSRKTGFSNIPICIEANSSNDLTLIKKIAGVLSNDIRILNSQQRLHLHMAAVFTNNFVNHLWDLSAKICNDNEIDFNILYPLMRETLNKLDDLSPAEAQTGPARRGDTKTVNKHLALLNGDSQKIYKLLSESIAHKYGKKL